MHKDVRCLARGPNTMAKGYKRFLVNVFRFHTNNIDYERKTQNSVVVVTAADVTYYGVLTDIIELEYTTGQKVVLFKCKWFDVLSYDRGCKKDKFGFVSVNFSRTIYSNDPFVLTSQIRQVFYVKESIDTNWHVVVKNQPGDFYDMYGQENPDNTWLYLHRQTRIIESLSDITLHEEEDVSWIRREVDGTTIEISLVMNLDFPVVNNEVVDEDEDEDEDEENDDDDEEEDDA